MILKNEPGHVWRLLGVSGVTKDEIWYHEISYNWISKTRFSQTSQDFDKIVAVSHLQRSDSEPEVDIFGIYVENHEGKNRECIIQIRFDFMKLGEKGVSPPLAWGPPDFWNLCPGGECFAPQWYWKRTRTRMETSWGIRNEQGWHLTSRDLIQLDFKKSKFSIFTRVCQKCCRAPASVVRFRTWG